MLILSGCGDESGGQVTPEKFKDLGVLDKAVADAGPPLDLLAIVDAAPDTVATPDLRPDSKPDTSPDSAPPDLAPPDLAPPDLPPPDLLIPDLPVPDLPVPDLMPPDFPVPDQMQPDQMQPDQMQPDLVPPDKGIPAVTIMTPAPLKPGAVNMSYQLYFQVQGGLGVGTYTWSGTVPGWGKLNAATGLFSGTPTSPGVYSITVRADSGPKYDQKTYTIKIVSALSLTAAAKPYMKAVCSASAKINLASLFTGGLGPFYCKVNQGAGTGVVPGNLAYDLTDATGCTLTGGFKATDKPGTYGFMVTVSDTLGQTLDIPIACKNGDCPSTDMVMKPAIWPPQTKLAGAAYSWTLGLKGVDVLCTDSACTKCSTCVDILMNITSPFTGDSKLDCLKPGDICLNNSTLGVISGCPSQTTWHGEPMVKTHTPARAKGLPAWNAMGLTVTYSGTKLSPCGSKKWTCQWVTLEQ